MGAKSHEAQASAIEAVTAAGFVSDGETRSETVRIGTVKSPILGHGKSGGELTTFGGRPRFTLPGTSFKVTIGPRSVCFYRSEKGKEPTDFKSFDTKDLNGIKATITATVGGAS